MSQSMAQQQASTQSVEWKLGSKCQLFDREHLKWNDGEVIGSFSDDKGEWIKVRCGGVVRNVLSIDPDLKQLEVIPSKEIKKLQHAVVQQPDIAPILQRILPSMTGQGLYTHSDSLVVNFTDSAVTEWTIFST